MGAISFSKRLKKVRCEKGITQQKLAEIAGLSVTHVIRLESVKRKSNPTMDTIKRISKALGVPVETFMTTGGIIQDRNSLLLPHNPLFYINS